MADQRGNQAQSPQSDKIIETTTRKSTHGTSYFQVHFYQRLFMLPPSCSKIAVTR